MNSARLLPLWFATFALAITGAIFVWFELGHELTIILGIRPRFERDSAVPSFTNDFTYGTKEVPAGSPSLAWLALGVVSLIILIALHRHSLGRTSPLAVLGFFICGPAVGAIRMLVFAFREALWIDGGMNTYRSDLAEFDLYLFSSKLLCAALFGAAFFALFAAIDKREEWFNEY